MPPIVDSVNKSPNNRYDPIYTSIVIDKVKKLGGLLKRNLEPTVKPRAITPANFQRLDPHNTFPGAFPILTPNQKQILVKYLNHWKSRKNMQNNREKLAEEKFNLYLKRRSIYVWYGRLKEKQLQKRWNRKRKNLANIPEDFQPQSILKKSVKPNSPKFHRKVFRIDQNQNVKTHSYPHENDNPIGYIEIIGDKNYVYNEEARKEVKKVLRIGNFYEEKYLYKARTTRVWKMALEQYREGKYADQKILKKLM
ncbi:16733_t:CDS:2 [Funneliformis caledonium]|uniref:16733_t:CDS:1 n=1 Tax=Funneliformis caledonium TaxID=1117310 RepID=A0A9N9GVR4_9GLOM|nr:16733_t:CDS:2 [Funneliformis caledonium]